ncbi:MAG: UvrD-helicase domain-containing protein [Dehalococcoidia bacterium]
MRAAAPVDQAARDRIRDDLDTTLFVEAGAGTGKTSALVGRIVRLVATGRAPIEQVAAITFTEAAAVELRDRVLVSLEAGAIDEGLPQDERARCAAALGALDEAAIETLHAFAARLLSLYPLAAGLPPGFEVSDDTLATVVFGARWLEHFDAMLDDADLRQPLRCAFALGVGADGLRAVARTLHEHWDRLGGPEAELPSGPPVDFDVSPLVNELSAICAERAHCVDDRDGLYLHLERLEPWTERLRGAVHDEVEVLRLLRSRSLRARSGQARNWRGVAPKEIRDALAGVDERCGALIEAATASTIPPLYASLRAFVIEYAEARRREGRLEFHDLLVRARGLLGDAEVRRALRARFRYLLIDEFQDTDPLQTEIALLLASESADVPAHWEGARPEAGRLFFVGDPKQSIYRFRRADIELYQAVQERFGADRLHLTQNFRSVPAVIEWVNALFGRLIDEPPPEGQAAYVALHATRAPHPEEVTVTLLGGPRDDSLGAVREAEASEIARALVATKAEGRRVLDYRDRDGAEHYRAARYQDVAILLPSRTALPHLLEALEAQDIPYRLESRSLVYGTQEVRELLAILGAIDDPTDEVALVASLRSPAFACADDELLAYSDAGGRWDHRSEPPAALAVEHPVVAGLGWLRGAYERRWWTPVSTLVEQVIRERRLFELAMVDRRPRERWQRLRFVLDQARGFEDAGGRTLREFLAWAQQQADEDASVVESVVPEADDDAVRIMTIHASKGLEFPIVLLSGLNVQSNYRAPAVLWATDGRPELQLSREVASGGFVALRQREAELDGLEHVRLLYVAATRARDHLLVSVHHPVSDTKSVAARIFARAGEFAALWRVPSEATMASTARSRTLPDAAVDGAGEREAWLQRRAEAVAERSAFAAVSATALARAAADVDDPNLRKEPPAEEEPPWRRAGPGRRSGARCTPCCRRSTSTAARSWRRRPALRPQRRVSRSVRSRLGAWRARRSPRTPCARL